jgi:hypothetical protein
MTMKQTHNIPDHIFKCLCETLDRHEAARRVLLVSPDGQTSVWVDSLDMSTGHYPQYDGWIDATHMGDDEFESLVRNLQSA